MPDNDFIIENGVLKKYNGTDINVVIPEGVTKISGLSFPNKKEIVSLILPEGITDVKDFVFFGFFKT